MPLDVAGYLRMARDQTIPPLLLEVVLRSGRSYYIKNVFTHFPDDGLFALRIWDLRALGEDGYATLLKALSDSHRRDYWQDYRTTQPKLDEGNLWLRVEDVDHIVEWHDSPLACHRSAA